MNPLDSSHIRVVASEESGFDPLIVPADSLREARTAQEDWALVSVPERLQVIERFRHLVAEHAAELADVSFPHNSRPKAEILVSEVLPLADACRFLEREADSMLAPRFFGEKGRPMWLFGTTAQVHREPLGVVLIIAPSNYPIFLPGVQVLQALVAGNAVLLKPGRHGSPA
ncbi:MAG TPA: aldehyde dehydrogenase family protein, partial [Clostridia bacterium]|nr:aldehyde dehydrogenase family protein [Clostridia bacterium]